MNHQVKAGLFTQQNIDIPLMDVTISVDIEGHLSRVSIQQKFKNKSPTAIEATYLFPIQDGSVIDSFKAFSNEKEIIGKVLEREEAFDEYDDAISEGHAAYLIDQERSNVLHASIGNLAPQQEVTIDISYFHALDIVDHTCRLLIPTVVAPKYVPQSMEKRYGMSETERWNSPRISEVPYYLNLTVNLSKLGEVISLESPSHPIKTKMNTEGAQVELAQRHNTLDRDFILEFELESVNHAYLVENQHGKFMSVLYQVPHNRDQKRVGREVIFMLDTSGSMEGASIREAINALSLLLRQLDEQDYFNIIFFDTRFQMLWPDVQAYNQKHLEEALQRLTQIYASGGTQILDPLQMLMNTKVTEGLSRQIVLLTDGAVSNEQEVIQLCRQHNSAATIFTFGIGNYVSESLVKGIAKATNGSAEFIHSGERIEPKVLRVLQKLSATPYQLNLRWNTEVKSQFDLDRLVFGGESIQVYAKLIDEHTIPNTIAIELNGQKQELSLQVLSAELKSRNHAVSALWANQQIEYLESQIKHDFGSLQDRPRRQQRKQNRDERLKEAIISLAVKHQIMSQFTSFVAVEKRANKDKIIGGMALKSTPLHSNLSSFGSSASFMGGASNLLQKNMIAPVASALFAPEMSSTSFTMPTGSAAPPAAPRRSRSLYLKYNALKHDEEKSFSRSSIPYERVSYSSVESDSSVSDLLQSRPRHIPNKLDLLFIALSLQQADGLFRWGSGLELFLGNSQVNDAQLRSVYELTRLVIKTLEAEYAEHVDLWRTAVDKAKTKLQSTSA